MDVRCYTDEDGRIDEAAFEAALDRRIMARVAIDPAYRNAENAEEQAQREDEISKQEEALLLMHRNFVTREATHTMTAKTHDYEVKATLTVTPAPDTILLGYLIGTAELPDGRTLEIVGSGGTLRFTVTGTKANAELKLNELAAEAVLLIDTHS